jgi:hypothetical protein
VLLRLRRPGAACDACVDFLRSQTVAEGNTLTLALKAGAVWRTDGASWSEAETDTSVDISGPCTSNGACRSTGNRNAQAGSP